MKKICFAFNHLEYSGGVSRVAIGIANHLAENPNVEVTLRPLFKCEKSIVSQLNPKIIVRPLFGFYFRGLHRYWKSCLINLSIIWFLIKTMILKLVSNTV